MAQHSHDRHDEGDHDEGDYDVIVIGAGPAGENAADYAIRGTDRTAVLIEDELVGGDCSYYACMPSKALLRPLDIAETSQHLGGLNPATIDPPGLLARRDEWVSSWDDSGQVSWAEKAGIDVVRGRGRLAGERTVEVTDADGHTRTLVANEAVVLAPGSVPVVPEELVDVRPWVSRDATAVHEIPGSVAVVGAGVVACESARWLAALGSRVTLLVRGDRLLAHSEPFVSDLVRDGLAGAGVDVRFGARVESATRAEFREPSGDRRYGHLHGGPVTLSVGGETLVVDELLVATGRRPATDDLGLESVGLSADVLRGRTHGHPLPSWLYTVGDVNGVAPLTHWGKYQARLVGRSIASCAAGVCEMAAPDDVPVPQVVFTAPQVAWVGVTSDDAAGQGRDIRTLDAGYTSAAGAALLRDDATGQARLVLDSEDRLIGATFVGPDVAELLHSATVAIVGRLTLAQLRHAVPSYPTASEVWLRLIEQ